MAKVMRGCELFHHCAATAYEGLSVFAPAMIMDNIVTGSVAVFSAAIIEEHAQRIVFCSSMARYGTNAVPFHRRLMCRGRRIVRHRQGRRRTGALINLAGVHGVQFPLASQGAATAHHRRAAEIRRPVSQRRVHRGDLMLQGRSPFIYGDGEQMRCFSHIEDCLSCLACNGTDRTRPGREWSVSAPIEEFVSINQLFRRLKGIVGFEGQAIHLTDQTRRKCARRTVRRPRRARYSGYRTTRGLEDGLRRPC